MQSSSVLRAKSPDLHMESYRTSRMLPNLPICVVFFFYRIISVSRLHGPFLFNSAIFLSHCYMDIMFSYFLLYANVLQAVVGCFYQILCYANGILQRELVPLWTLCGASGG